MIEFVLGLAVGAGGMLAKEQFVDKDASQKQQRQAEQLSDENERLRMRLNEANRHNEELLAENERLRRSSSDHSDKLDDTLEDLAKAKKELSKVQLQNEELARKLQEYRTVCESYKLELAKYKELWVFGIGCSSAQIKMRHL